MDGKLAHGTGYPVSFADTVSCQLLVVNCQLSALSPIVCLRAKILIYKFEMLPGRLVNGEDKNIS